MSEGFASYSDVSVEEFVRKIEAQLSNVPKQEAKVAQYILLNLDSLSFETGSSIAQKAGVAEITVGRLLRRFGCSGMKEFKQMLRQKYSISGEALRTQQTEMPPSLRDQMSAEIASLHTVYGQTTELHFRSAADYLWESETVYVTGFQTVRGLAEDTARRLSLARPRVRYLAPHDSMLGEWIEDAQASSSCLLVIDVVPYAAECQTLVRLAKEQGRRVVLVTDEYCHWSRDLTDVTIHAPSATGLFLESTLGLVAALALLINETAMRQPDNSAHRLREWKRNARKLKIF
jgi:DNA-binding MurR/RpiR family transcriptional regulator